MAAKPATAIATPVDLKALMEKAAADAKAKEKAEAKFISFKSGVMSYNEQPAKDNKIQIVVLHSVFENDFFPDRYDPKKVVSPACWAVAHDEEDMGPDPDKVTKMISESCTDCEYNAWGSDLEGGKGKACKNVRRLALIQAAQMGDERPDLIFAKLPVTSVANWSKYVNQISNVVKRPAWGVITEMSVVPDAKSQFKVNFQFMGLVDDAHLEKMMELQASTIDDVLFGYPKNEQ
jgi:hypothetical protein